MYCLLAVLFLFSSVSITRGTPVILTGSSPSGDAVIAISSDNPDIEKYLRFGFSKSDNDDAIITEPREDFNSKSIAASSRISSAETRVPNTGRGFASTGFDPFLLPFFFAPLNLEGIGLSNPSSWNWQKGVEGYYDPSFARNGQITAVAAVNDNGHIYSNVKTVNINNKGL